MAAILHTSFAVTWIFQKYAFSVLYYMYILKYYVYKNLGKYFDIYLTRSPTYLSTCCVWPERRNLYISAIFCSISFFFTRQIWIQIFRSWKILYAYNFHRIFFLIFSGTKGFMGEPAVSPTYCPINGAYTFTYSVNDGTESSLECSSQTSELSDCPHGFGFNLKFQGCSFGNMEMSFHCLGNWWVLIEFYFVWFSVKLIHFNWIWINIMFFCLHF